MLETTDLKSRGKAHAVDVGKRRSLLICPSTHVMSRSTYSGAVTLMGCEGGEVIHRAGHRRGARARPTLVIVTPSAQRYSKRDPADMVGHEAFVQNSATVP